jgi:hypothetical protein
MGRSPLSTARAMSSWLVRCAKGTSRVSICAPVSTERTDERKTERTACLPHDDAIAVYVSCLCVRPSLHHLGRLPVYRPNGNQPSRTSRTRWRDALRIRCWPVSREL